jgi:hypothetical protein
LRLFKFAKIITNGMVVQELCQKSEPKIQDHANDNYKKNKQYTENRTQCKAVGRDMKTGICLYFATDNHKNSK